MREFERVPPQEHWDALAVWRLMELKRTLWHMESGDARLAPWERRLRELEDLEDPIDRLLAQIEGGVPFAAAAREFSRGATAADGGAVGWVMVDQLDPGIGREVEHHDTELRPWILLEDRPRPARRRLELLVR